MVAKLIHPTGTIVLCEHGHEVCEITRDLRRGDTNYSTAVGKWRSGQNQAHQGDFLPLKCWCGGIYFHSADGRLLALMI